MSSDIERYQRLITPFVKRALATANGAANGTTVISTQVPGIGEFGLGEANDFWRDSEILILTGDMKDQLRRVTAWVQATGTLTVDHRFNNPDVSLLTANVILGAVIIPVMDASVFSAGEAYIWDAANAETVTITLVDTVLNQLTIAAPGLVNPYTIAAGAAISMSPRILLGTRFVIMSPTLIVAAFGTLFNVNLVQVLNAALSAANPVMAGIFDALGNRMPAGDADARSVHTVEAIPTAVLEDQVTLTGNAQQLPDEPCRSVTLENPITNNVVCVGHSNAVTLLNGYRLQPGATWSLAIDNVNKIWVIGTNQQVISFGGVL